MIALLAATATALSSTSHRIYPGRLGTAFRIKQCVPREDALAIGEKALALPSSAWASDRHASYATRDCSAHDVEPDFDSIVWSRVRSRLAHCYEVPEAALCLIDAFVVRYDAAAGESAELAPHRDAGPLSFNVLLSDGNAFDGGATTFVDAEFDGVDEDAGDAVLHPGQTRHGGRRTTRGTRIIAVGFVEIDGFEVNVDGYDGAASERHQRDLGRASNLRRLQSRLDHAPLGKAFAKVCAEGAVVRREREADAAFATEMLQATPSSRVAVAVSTPPSEREIHEAAATLEREGVVVLRSVDGLLAGVQKGDAVAAVEALDDRLAGRGTDAAVDEPTLARRSELRHDVRLDGSTADPRWRELAERVAAIARRVLGESSWEAATAGCVISRPGAGPQFYHADGMDAYFNAFVPLVDVPTALGPTEFALRSHADEHAVAYAPTLEGDDRYEKCAPELRRGDVVLFSYATLHRGLPNTGDASRPVFYVTMAPPGAVDAINFAEAPGDA
jgi:hypothetical protein